ncbi:MAG: transposase [Acidimicrobiales bacterium]
MTVADRDEAARLAELPAEATVALRDVAASIKDGLMAFCCSAGLAVVSQLMEEELTASVGPKGRHDAERAGTRNGSAPGSVVLGGRSVPVRRPRATKSGGGEVRLDSYATFSDRDLLTQVAVERMLAGVATRRHTLVAEPIGEELEEMARGDSRSAVSRRFVAATENKLAELLSSDLSVHDAAVLMIDGIVFHECCCVVALLITADGTKIPVGVWEGDTENTTGREAPLGRSRGPWAALRDRTALGDRRRQGARSRHQARLRPPRRRATLRVAQASRCR